MLPRTLFLTAISAMQVTAAPYEHPKDFNAEPWSLMNFRRACAEDQSRCDYNFLIAEQADKAPKYCSFTIEAGEGIPAYQTGFSLAKCPAATEYSINGGWNTAGFVTLTVINDEKALLSFFAFEDKALENGTEAAPQQSQVYLHVVPQKRSTHKSGHGGSLGEAHDWKLLNVVRYLTNLGTPSETLVISFMIEGGNNTPPESCFLEVPVSEKGLSFFNHDCDGDNGFKVSWGHNLDTDEAVMTVVNKNHRNHAFFGFNGVSSRVMLGANGPSPTKELPREV